ncbi:hypothetical protein, partial [Vibrio splendidus]|uniref:hypothetical protein n=1 Tax=Vibrio splendidus TaxID=29497 RepID=UPI003D10551C
MNFYIASSILIFILIRPVFYWVSPAISRLSDFLAFIFVLAFVIVFRKHKFERFIAYFLGLYLLVILTSLLRNEIVTGYLSMIDMVELFRPVMYVSFYVFGIICAKQNMQIPIIKVLFYVLLLNSFLCLIMYLAPE